jgi:hypothetical protein
LAGRCAISKDAPEPPDPQETAQASTSTNVGTAIANAMMGNVSQYGPTGSTVTEQTGTYWWGDPYTGTWYEIPTFSETTTLSPEEQAKYDLGVQAETNLLKLATDQSGKLNTLLSTPFDLNSLGPMPTAPSLSGLSPNFQTSYVDDFSEDRKRVEDALMQSMMPQLERQKDQLRTSAINSGFRAGSEGFDTTMGEANRAMSDAQLQAILYAGQEQSRLADLSRQQATFGNTWAQQDYTNRYSGAQQDYTNALTSRQRAIEEAFAVRNQPINEISALLGATQVNMPQFSDVSMPTIPTTDVAGLINENYDQQLAAYQYEQSAMNSILGGLLGMGSSLLGNPALFGTSDRRLKTDIKVIGRADNGLNIYQYRYVWGGPMQIGVMADEVEKIHPDAVAEHNGVKLVNYELALEAA